MRRCLSALCLTAALTLALAAPAAAQAAPIGDVAFSYSFLYDNDVRSNPPGLTGNFPAGWLFSASARVKGPLSIAGEVGGNYQTATIEGVNVSIGVYTYLGGVRYSPRFETRVRPFAQLLAGLARATASVSGIDATASGNAFAGEIGAGVDIAATTKFAVRVQGDYRGLLASGVYWSEFRFATGVVYSF